MLFLGSVESTSEDVPPDPISVRDLDEGDASLKSAQGLSDEEGI